jgi:hypothetical protein
MKNKQLDATLRSIAKIYGIIAATLLMLSFTYFAAIWGQNTSFKKAKANLPSTDLSMVTIDGLKPGMPLGKLSQDAFAFGEDGVKYNSFSDLEGRNVIISSITGDLFWHKTSTIAYNGRVLDAAGTISYTPDFVLRTANAAIVEALGENYLTYAIRHESTSPSVIYRDQTNGLELRLYYYGAELSKADEPLDLPDYRSGGESERFLTALASPLATAFWLSFHIRLGLSMPLIDHILLPLWFAYLLLPAGCCFKFRRKRVIIPIIAGYIVVSGVQFFLFMAWVSLM